MSDFEVNHREHAMAYKAKAVKILYRDPKGAMPARKEGHTIKLQYMPLVLLSVDHQRPARTALLVSESQGSRERQHVYLNAQKDDISPFHTSAHPTHKFRAPDDDALIEKKVKYPTK
jgi:hypothetical protein